jgi:gluconate 2-dehydrogenase gamma chain
MHRRDWLAAAFGAAWPEILAAQHHARQAARSGRLPATLDARAAADIEALAAEIIPATETPGAREAGVIHFIDRALATFAAADLPLYREGLAAADAKRAALFPGSSTIAALTSPQRIELLRAVESSPFFQTLRTHTIMGFLADPAYGADPTAGHRTLGFQPAHEYTPPFGWYDDKANGGPN